MSKPKNWPETLPYLTAPLHDKSLTPSHLSHLRAKPPAAPSSSLPVIPASATPTPNPLVKIQPVRDPSHPAHGQHGLFAARDLKPGTWITAYLGRVHTESATDGTSDYDLWLDREAGLAVDAAGAGNEARFVNDYRGVRDQGGPNAEFGTAWCERWGQLCVGFWVVRAAGKGKGKGKGGIRKGEEILVSYGKGFWDGRKGEEEQEEDGQSHHG